MPSNSNSLFRPEDWFNLPPPYDPKAFSNTDLFSNIPGSDINSATDIGQRGMRFAEDMYNRRLPFENYMLNFARSIGSGDNAWLTPLLAPMANVLSSQTPQAQRQIRDSTSGGAMMEGLARIPEKAMGALGQAGSQIQQQGFNILADMGTGLSQQMLPWFAVAAQAMKKPASGGGGSPI